MENTINTTNHLIFTNIDLFKIYVVEILNIVPKLLPNLSIQDITIFSLGLKGLIERIVEISPHTSIQECMYYYNMMVLQQTKPFIDIHSYLLQQYVLEKTKQIEDALKVEKTIQYLIDDIQKMDINSDMEAEKEPEAVHTTVIPVQTSFGSTGKEISFQQFTNERLECRNHYVVDGMNFFAEIQRAFTKEPLSLGHMIVDRNVKDHQFECSVEQERAFSCAIDFFNKAVPAGSFIHFVFKKFGSNDYWENFKELFANRFMNPANSLRHNYDFYVAHPVLNNGMDGECDDRLAVRLAIQMNAHIVSLDLYRSMRSHWQRISRFQHYDDYPLREPSIETFSSFLDVEETYCLPRIKFEFWVEKSIFSDTGHIKMNWSEINC